jgi:hypothetical protein
MPLVTCDYAPFGRGWQETFDSATFDDVNAL